MTSPSEPSARHDRGAAASRVPAGLEHRTIRVNGVGLHLAMQGTGPLVLLCHGWPELWYAWRHQIPALAAAGYRAAALDLRGFGGSDAPAEIEAYTMMHLVGDVVGLIGALGERQAVVVGHDWGANVAWYAALFRPDLVRAVVAMSVPFARRPPAPPVRALREAGQSGSTGCTSRSPGVAEAEFERDPAATLRRILFGGSGEGQEGRTPGAGLTLPSTGRFPGRQARRVGGCRPGSASRSSPSWLPSIGGRDSGAGSTSIGTSTGTGRCWRPGRTRRCDRPALFVAGSRDPVINLPARRAALAEMPSLVPELRRSLIIEGAGHWIQQERPGEVNAALLEFLRGLPPPAGG